MPYGLSKIAERGALAQENSHVEAVCYKRETPDHDADAQLEEKERRIDCISPNGARVEMGR